MNARVSPIFPLLLLAGLLLSACNAQPRLPTGLPVITPSGAQTGEPEKSEAAIPNPASVNCVEKGFRSEIRTAEDGSQYGVCIFDDGSECDEWLYLRGECSPGQATSVPGPASSATDQSTRVVEAAKDFLAGQLKIDPAEIALQSVEEKDWPDACLGLARSDEMCAQVITPGYRVVLSAAGQEYTLRTSRNARIIRLQP